MGREKRIGSNMKVFFKKLQLHMLSTNCVIQKGGTHEKTSS